MNNKKKINKRTLIFVLEFILLLAIVSCISNVFYWKNDFSLIYSENSLDDIAYKNWIGSLGAHLSHYIMDMGFGVMSIILMMYIFVFNLHLLFTKIFRRLPFLRLVKVFNITFFTSLTFAILPIESKIWGGGVGQQILFFCSKYIGYTGVLLITILVWMLVLKEYYPKIIKLILAIKMDTNKIKELFNFKKVIKKQPLIIEQKKENQKETLETPYTTEKDYEIQSDPVVDIEIETTQETPPEEEVEIETLEKVVENKINPQQNLSIEIDNPINTEIENTVQATTDNNQENPEPDLEIEVAPTEKEDSLKQEKSNVEYGKIGSTYNPREDLPDYVFPPIDLLKKYSTTQFNVDGTELEKNKKRIVEILSTYKIGISKIKATIGPTVTLYEIVPDAGIKVSKIKGLEDDIALSLSALGIRIIAPIPGKGTIGIEVPNEHPQIVPMYDSITSPRFVTDKSIQLPVVMGKTISGETFVFDLAKMPHLLMAGATGQGKSVGLNVILTSLLYRKHPSELKFVLIDPKKVELTLFNKLVRHYLAMLPDESDAIITDTSKVVCTLNSLCIEMDARYELLKNATARNIVEYNDKFLNRKLNPEDGHKFLPYIVLVIDEFADLIMTAGKEVEVPIARLAQLARAIGIHLIVATQRPSVNVITGIIKANFPARIAFRVTSKVDSRTILDTSGAENLIGKGDMLFINGTEPIRIQSSFVDTPEIERICEYIGSQKGYSDAYFLPEVENESASNGNGSIQDKDPLFEDAARLIVGEQKGSTSLIQRKLKLGYNRAGRLMDQLEETGIVGPFEGSKARKIMVSDLNALEQLLKYKDEN